MFSTFDLRSSPLGPLAALLLLFAPLLGGCAEEATDDAVAVGKNSGTAAATNNSDLGQLVDRPPLEDVRGTVIRGAMRWRGPKNWSENDVSGKPFVAAEYFLPGNAEEQPSMCRMRNGSAPKAGADDEKLAEKRVGDIRVKTVDGKSLRREVRKERWQLGQFAWVIGTAEGVWYDDGTIINPRKPAFVVPGYTGFAAAPVAPGPPFIVNCWGPTELITGQLPAIKAWLGSIELDPIQ